MAKKQPEIQQSLQQAIEKNPKLGLFVAGLTLHDGNVEAAADEVGWTKGYGRRLMKRYPEIRAAVVRAQEKTQQSVRERWARMHDRALQRISEHVENEDPRISLEACKVVVERVEGRPRQGIDLNLIEREEDAMESVRYRFALSLATEYSWELEYALQYADEHPDEMQEWWELVQEDFGPAAQA